MYSLCLEHCSYLHSLVPRPGNEAINITSTDWIITADTPVLNDGHRNQTFWQFSKNKWMADWRVIMHADCSPVPRSFSSISIQANGLRMRLEPRLRHSYVSSTCVASFPNIWPPVSNERHIISRYVNEIWSWELCHCDQHEKIFQILS